DVWKPSIGEKLVAKREFNNPMDKHAVKVVKDDETVGHLPRGFSRIAWCFLALQFVTPTSQFTPFESNGLVYKPHPRFLTQNFGKK
ncbi:unnamed protein product, partial [Porites lobata]